MARASLRSAAAMPEQFDEPWNLAAMLPEVVEAAGSGDEATFDAAVADALENFQAQKAAEEETPAKSGSTQVSSQCLLRSRMAMARNAERTRVVVELLSLKVRRAFAHRQLPLVTSPVSDDAQVSLEPVDPHRLATDLYSEGVLGFVKNHVMSIIGEWQHLVRGHPLHLSLFQVGLVYASSARFGYSLRRMELRYRLDRLAGSPQVASRSFKEYVDSCGADALQQMMSGASVEAEAVLRQRVHSLFGSLSELSREIHDALGPMPANEEAVAQLRAGIESGTVTSVRLTVGDLRRLALEGTAFGFQLGTSEAEVDSLYELQPDDGRGGMPQLLGGLDGVSYHHQYGLPGLPSSEES